MFFDKGYLGIPNYNWVNYFIDNNLYVNITKLVDNEEFKSEFCNYLYHCRSLLNIFF